MREFLDHLEGVRPTVDDSFVAKCPAHDDRSPSLAIKFVHDKILIHCFAGCSRHDVVGALGLSESDLFDGDFTPTKARWNPITLIKIFASEFEIAFMAVDDVAEGRPLSPEDRHRVKRCKYTLQETLKLIKKS